MFTTTLPSVTLKLEDYCDELLCLDPDPSDGIGILIGRLLGIVLVVALIILLLYLILGAYEWITSAGDSAKLQSARNRMLHAILGMLILASVIALFNLVQYVLGIDLLQFS